MCIRFLKASLHSVDLGRPTGLHLSLWTLRLESHYPPGPPVSSVEALGSLTIGVEPAKV
jgi:hypothetical protein